ncbi:MAG: serine protease, partial [Chitinispirillaceae bacterium]|nr:serine protease [Chitinispirillaceae bacterium]
MKLRLLAVVPFFLLVTSCTTENIFHAPAPIIYPVDSSAILIQRFYAEYQPNIFLAGILISDSVAGPQYVLETGTAFKAAGRYYTNAHVALVLHKLAGAFMPDWVERPVYSAKLVLIPSGKSVRETFLLDGFSLHPEYDTTLECADLAQLYLKSVPADTLGLPIASANETDALEAGQEIWTMGFPGETQYESYVYPRATLKRGYISALRSIAAPYSPSLPNQLIQHDMDLTGGTSGSPVFSISGTVIGVNFSGNDQGSVNFAVRSDLLFTDTSM